ncbi:WbqC family protein [Psychrobacter sp. DAB_AL62B]|uniref:WbqC family protein n=1 Tax=Psychrobacter sp. DAB_AL62B TaxID=1028420 RepID=UPI0023811173|nr:WbqC family protein [Psychrobacter sp. DAB_AL62B]MDE4453835.1 hypothetical protein [Psychrobacter sp. DAB_AL62B]
MILAVMQPYLFPYIGYYQLVYASSIFIFYDDVNFIKQSYINRNNILANGKALRFTLPVLGASSNVPIESLEYSDGKKILRTIAQAYSKSPYFYDVFSMIESVFSQENRSVTHINRMSIQVVFEYLNIDKKLLTASQINYDRTQERADRLLELSKMHSCDQYINSQGGKKLYQKGYFEEQGVELNFIETEIQPYSQNSDEFIPYLSMIDILMNCSKDDIVEMLSSYKLS